MLKAASDFLKSLANSQPGVSGGASGGSDVAQFPAACIGAEVPSDEGPQRDTVAGPTGTHRASSSTTGIPSSAASSSDRKRSGGDHPAVEAPKRRRFRDPMTPQDVLEVLGRWEKDPEADRIMTAARALIDVKNIA